MVAVAAVVAVGVAVVVAVAVAVVVKYINWNPERSQAWRRNAKKALPPRTEERNILPGIYQTELKAWNIKKYYGVGGIQ